MSADTRPLKRHVAAVVVGNALEFYDFLTYSFFAVYIGNAFFPGGDATTKLLMSLATFGVGFATRPVGGVVIGMIGDRVGRKPAMVLSFALMGLGMLGVVFTPSYAAIGVAAPILVVVFRLIQGFALGGEVGPTTAFLVEAPPARMRGFYGSLQSASQYVATFVAGIVATGLASVLSAQAMASWGWRAAFFVGVLIIPFGLLVRRSLPETVGTAPPTETSASAGDHWRLSLLALMLLGGATIATYVILYLATYGQATLHIAPRWTFVATLAIGFCGTVFAPLGGYLSDRWGRRPVVMVATVGLTVVTIPAFVLLNAVPTGPVLVAVAAVLTALLGCAGGPGIMTISELLPPGLRSGLMATLYAIAIAVFGGSAQFIVAWLADLLNDPLTPAYYMTGAAIVGFVAMALMQEGAPVKRASA